MVVFRHRYDVDDEDARHPMPWRGIERSIGRVVSICKRPRDATRDTALAQLPRLASIAQLLDVIERDDEVYFIEAAAPGVPLSAERRDPKVQLGPWLALVDDLVRMHDAGVEHGGLHNDAIVRENERFVLRGLHEPRNERTADAAGAGGALMRSLAPEAFAPIDLHTLGMALVEQRITLRDAAARMRDALDAHARKVDVDGALRAPSPWEALRALRDEGVLHHVDTAQRVAKALAPRLLRTLDERSTRDALDDLALLPLDDDLLALADDTAAAQGARVAALRVLERRRSGAPEALVRLLHDGNPVVAAAARRAFARVDDAALRVVSGAFARCPHGWRAAMADSDAAGPRYCATCDARVVPATDGETLLDGEVPADQPILILDGEEGRHRFAMVSDEVVIGRSADCDIAIGHNDVAMHHLTVRHLDGRFWVEAFPGATFERARGLPREWYVVHDGISFGGFTLTFDVMPGLRVRDTNVQGPSGVDVLVARTRALAVHAGTIGGVPYPARDVGTGTYAVVEEVTQPPSFDRVVVVWSVERGLDGAVADLDSLVLAEGVSARLNRLQIAFEDGAVRVFDPDHIPTYAADDDEWMDEGTDPFSGDDDE